MKKPDAMMLQELQRAIEDNAPELLRPLVEAGVPIDQKIGDSPRKSLLEFAIGENAVAVAKFLITAGAKLNKGVYRPLIHAALFNRTEIVQMLLDAGADPNVTISTPEENLRHETALMHAVDRPEKLPIVELLLQYHADPNLTTNQGLTALDYAVDAENVFAVRRLLEAGCKPIGPILHGPVFNGTKTGLELVKLLIAGGADLNAIGNREAHLEGRTALDGARQQLEEKESSIQQLESRPREDWEEQTLERWRSEASIYNEMIQELTGAKAT
jgi:hypothetical protein